MNPGYMTAAQHDYIVDLRRQIGGYGDFVDTTLTKASASQYIHYLKERLARRVNTTEGARIKMNESHTIASCNSQSDLDRAEEQVREYKRRIKAEKRARREAAAAKAEKARLRKVAYLALEQLANGPAGPTALGAAVELLNRTSA